MWYKEQSEIIVFPRIFKGIKIGYQGDYSLRFELIYESEQGSKKSAYPYIFKSHNFFIDKEITSPSTVRKVNLDHEQKTRGAYTHIEDNQAYFETKSFTIKYENHVEELHDVCIFKHEQNMKMKGELYLLISLQSHKKATSKIEGSSKSESESKIKTVYTKRMFLKRGKQEINEFLEVELTDNDYFGAVEMYVGSVHLGWKLRNNKMSLCKFLSLDIKEKEKYVELSQTKEFITCKSIAGKKIKEAVQDNIDETNSYHGITIIKSIEEIKRVLNCLLKVAESLKIKLNDPSSEYFAMVKSLSEQTAILTLEDMKEYYECNTENVLYFTIHYENTRLVYHIRSLWQKFITIIKETSLQEFVHLWNLDIKSKDNEWLGKSLRFISVHSDRQVSETEINKSINWREESMELNSPQSVHRNSMFDFLKKSNKVEKQEISQRNTENILDIRCSSIDNFKIKRDELLGNAQIFFEEDISHPYMIIENFSESDPRSKFQSENSLSLVVFLHGFKGNEYDLEKASEYLLKYNPRADILRIHTILPDTDHSIEEMSHIVSKEIKKHIICSVPKIESISIIGYSLGGVVGRACLGHLSQFKDKMNLFVSFSSPHLGTNLTGNNFVKAGIWFMINFDKCKALEELNTCKDLKTANKSYMKALSEQDYLKWFNKVVLVSCKEDEFVPHISSRIQEYERNFNNDNDDDADTNFGDSDRAKINKVKSLEKIFKSRGVKREEISEIKEMSYNIRSVCNRIERVEVWFDMERKKGKIDKLTGRQAHIEFLDNNRFLKWFFKLYGKQL